MQINQECNKEDSTLNMSKSLKKGFTFIELLVAVTVMLFLSAGAYYGLSSFLESSKRSSTKTILDKMQSQINMYQAETGNYPESLNDLVKSNVASSIPNDSWGKKFVYQLTPDADHPYELFSYGGNKGNREPKNKRITIRSLDR